jgi:phage tail-like protein
MPNSSSDSTQVRDAGPSRRQFFHKAGLAAGGLYALAGTAILQPWVSAAEAATDKRSYIAGRFGLELDNTYCGAINQFEGGNFTADVVSERPGADRIARKHLGIPRIEPITVETGLDMGKPWYDWIARTMNGEVVRKSGAVIEMDFNFKEVGRRTFTNAFVSDIEFPTLDAAAKDPGKMTVSLVPEQLQLVAGSGKQNSPSGAKKGWLASNFRLNIKGLEAATQRATKIAAFTVKQQVSAGQPGTSKFSSLALGPLDFPNLAVTVPEASSGPLYAWLDDFLVKGNNGPGKDLPGVLEFLAPDQKPLAALQLAGLGIFKLSTEGSSGADKVRQVRAEIFCQKMTFTVS